TFVGQDSIVVVRRIINDTIGIVSHERTGASLCHRLAALPFIAATCLHLARLIPHRQLAPPHLAFVICHLAFVICHLAFAIRLFCFPIPRSEFAGPPRSRCVWWGGVFLSDHCELGESSEKSLRKTRDQQGW